MGDAMQAFDFENLTIKRESRNDQGMRDMEKKEK
jgi:hypothetical protein